MRDPRSLLSPPAPGQPPWSGAPSTLIIPLLVAILVLILLAVVGIVLVAIFMKGESGTVIAAIAGTVVPTVTVLVLLLQSNANGQAIAQLRAEQHQTHEAVNGKVDMLLDAVSTKADLEGELRGREVGRLEGKAQAAEVTEALLSPPPIINPNVRDADPGHRAHDGPKEPTS